MDSPRAVLLASQWHARWDRAAREGMAVLTHNDHTLPLASPLPVFQSATFA